MPCLVTERKLCPVPLTSEQVRKTLWMGMLLHSCSLIFGLFGFGVVSENDSEERESLLLSIDLIDKPSHSCADLLRISSLLLLGCGIAGLVSQVLSYPRVSPFVLTIAPIVPWGLAVVSLVEAVMTDVHGYNEILIKSLRRESYSVIHHQWIRGVHDYDHEWDEKFQTGLECCGIIDKRDWFLSACNCIPPSCCKSSEKVTCENNFLVGTPSGGSTYRKLGTDPSNFINNEKYLWGKSCVPKLQGIVEDWRNQWVRISLFWICVQFWTAFLTAYLCYIIQELNETERGRGQLQQYKWSLPVKHRLTKRQLHGTFKSLRILRHKELEKKHENLVYKDFIEIKPPPAGNKFLHNVTTM